MAVNLEQYIVNEEVGHGVFKGFQPTSLEDFLAEAKAVKEDDAEAAAVADAPVQEEDDEKEKEAEASKGKEAKADDEKTLEQPKADDIKVAEAKGKKTK